MDNKKLKIAIQGIAGCFHDAAARAHFAGREIETVECETFEVLFDHLASDASMLGIVAIENTIAGTILPNYELLRRSELMVVGEHKMRISHVLCALPGQSIADIGQVESHPMALHQCEQFLRAYPHMHMVERFDTAGAARDIARDGASGRAAVCGALAAKLYGMDILAEGIETNKRNFTRFLILSNSLMARDIAPAPTHADKASVVFTLPHTQGALSKILTILSFYDINLLKIQSTPIVGREWEYRFYVDLAFDDAVRFHQSLDAVRPLMNDFRLLGLYNDTPTPDE